MPQKSIEFLLSPSDLWTLLFKRKRCSGCGGALRRATESARSGPQWQLGDSQDAPGEVSVWYGDRIKARWVYHCDRCKRIYTLADLRGGG